MVSTYDPNKVLVLWKGIPIGGFGIDSMIKVTQTSDRVTKQDGCTGEVVRVMQRSKSGSVEVTLLASSQSNDLLSAAQIEDELTGLGVGPLMIKDLNGTTIIQAASAWIAKIPEINFGKETSDRTWTLDYAVGNINVGGILKV